LVCTTSFFRDNVTVVPLVSILIPAYNAERYLEQTLRSALAQTWSRKEVIVVNDGSRDQTLAVARSFDSPLVKVIDQENRGQSASENRAFAESQGDLLEYLDADDLLAPDKIEVQVRRLADAGHDCVASGRWGRFHDDPAKARFVPEPFWTDMAPVDWLVSAWERHSMMHGAAWLIPRGIAERAGPWDETLSLINDFDFFPRVLLACRQVCFCPDAVTYYRSGLPTSLSGAKGHAAWTSAIRALEASTTRLLAVEDSPRTRRACIRQFQEFIYDAYPDCSDLCERAERRIVALGGPLFAPQGGPTFRLASRFVGWRTAKRLQRLVRRWSSKSFEKSRA
jgi:glycosyltransferase involved in cell wall biosynthesis